MREFRTKHDVGREWLLTVALIGPCVAACVRNLCAVFTTIFCFKKDKNQICIVVIIKFNFDSLPEALNKEI